MASKLQMSRRASLNALVEDMLSELETEFLQGEGSNTGSCSGWESDPQSFSITLAKFYYRTDFPNPRSPNPSVVSVTGAWDPKVAFWVTFDNGDVVGVSMKLVPTQHIAVAGPRVGNICPFNLRCRYTYSCSASGSISFTKISCG